MRAGYLNVRCGACQSQEPEVRDALGCNPLVSANAPAWQCVDGEMVTSYMNCPSHFIPETVWNFNRIYQGYQGKRFALPTVHHQPKKYLDMCAIFDSEFAHFSNLKNEEDRKRIEFERLSRMRIQ